MLITTLAEYDQAIEIPSRIVLADILLEDVDKYIKTAIRLADEYRLEPRVLESEHEGRVHLHFVFLDFASLEYARYLDLVLSILRFR